MFAGKRFNRNFSRKLMLARIFFLAVLSFFIGMLPACKTVDVGSGSGQIGLQNERDNVFHRVEGGGWITAFLNLKSAGVPEASMEIVAVDIGTANNWVPLRSTRLIVDSKKVGNGQIFIARNGVSPGYYDRLRFVIQNMAIPGKSGEMLPASQSSTVEMDLPTGFNLIKGDSHSIFVTWDVEKSLEDSQGFASGLHANLQAIPLLSNLLFVACPELDTVYVIRTDKNWVISSIGVPGAPAYLDVDLVRDRLYVLATEDYSVKVIDLTAYKVVDRYFVQMDYAPGFMVVDPGKRYAFLLDEMGKGMAKLDLSNGAVTNKVRLSFNPRYATYLEEQQNLAVSTAETNFLYFLSPETLATVGSIPVGNRPEGVLGFRGNVLVAESGSNSVTAFAINDRKQQASVNVGFTPKRLFMKGNQLYATSYGDGTVTVMLPGQLNISREIFVGGKPLEISGSASNRWLYVGNGTQGGLTVIDATSNRITGFIDLGTMALGMAVID